MPWGAAIGAAGAIGGGLLNSSGAKDAAKIQAKAAKEIDRRSREERAPWTNAGKGALEQLVQGTQPGGQFADRFGPEDYKNSDAYKFALQEGLGALNNSAAARGGLLGTNNQRDNIKYAEGVAGQFQNQAFNQWMNEQKLLMQPLQSLAGQGFDSANATADTTGTALALGAGAQAGGVAGSANAWGKALGGLTNTLMANQNSLKGLFGPSSPSAAPNMGAGLTPLNSSEFSAPDPYIEGGAGDFNYSDERLKKDMVRIGFTDNGVPIYRYKMKSDGETRMGVSAQDMERVRPDAVARGHGGYRMVDYSKVA